MLGVADCEQLLRSEVLAMQTEKQDISSAAAKATVFRNLHNGPEPLLLANVWDVAGACLIESLGLPAVATSSAAIANSLGYRDGERISRKQMFEVIERIASAVKVPVTADIEAGYAKTAEEMAETTRQLIATGAVGLNLEDGEDDRARLTPIADQVANIETVRSASAVAGVPLVINARTDAFWCKGISAENRWAETITRVNAYRQAGADCVFVPSMKEPADITRLLKESPGPLNIIAFPGTPSVPDLVRLGVVRISLGPFPYRAALGMLKTIANELRETGSYQSMFSNMISAEEVNRWFA